MTDKPYRCFTGKLIANATVTTSRWFESWQQQFKQTDLAEILSSEQANALARLLPLLMCGEQSAQLVFNQTLEQYQADSEQALYQQLAEIEADEQFHDLALQQVFAQLPTPNDLSRITRRAQLFFCRLNQTKSKQEHFARIRHLDACVTIIMSAMAASALGPQHIISQLFQHIQKDEARHVKISSQYVRLLGGDNKTILAEAQMIKRELVNLLSSEKTAFETLSVDSQQLFARILK